MTSSAQSTPGQRMWIGCAVWAYKGFVGSLYPEQSSPKDFLKLYVERLTAIEGNTTFYALPSEETVRKWRDTFPEGFAFCPKLDRRITHEHKLVQAEHLTERFIARMRLLGEHLGPVLLQLPPSFSPSSFEDLKRYLHRWPRDIEVAIEVRHQGWWQDAPARGLRDLLERQGAARVHLDTRPVYSSEVDSQAMSERKKPRLPLTLTRTAPFTMVRFIAHPDAAYTEPFLAEWVETLSTWLERPDERVYFFSHCPIEERSPGYARDLHARLQRRLPALADLPWAHVKSPPTQTSLF